jgi:hypothetical protein
LVGSRAGAQPPLEPARIVRYFAPHYPLPELAAGTEGAVECSVTIGPLDTPEQVVVESATTPAFAEAAVDALRATRWRAARVGGVARRSVLRTTVRFALQRQPDEDASACGERTVLVEGEVLESGVRLPLIGVELIAQGCAVGATTDAHGRFQLRLPPGEHLLVAAIPLFRPVVERVTVEPGKTPSVSLRALRREVGNFEATVSGARTQAASSKSTLTHEELRNVPGSQSDPIRVLENLPGVARAPFAGGQLIVRGARPNDTGAYFDGQRIPILYHLLNGPSVLAEDMVERIDFYTGGVGVFYGRQLTGYVEVVPRSGDTDRLHGAVAADLNKGSAFLRGPLGEATKFAAGARVGYVNPLLQFYADSHKPYQVPTYWDYQTRVERLLPDSSNLVLTAFGSGDSYAHINPARGNTDSFSDQEVHFHRLQLRWDKRLSETVSLTLSPQAGVGDDVTRTQGQGAGAFAEPERIAHQSQSLGLRSRLTARLLPALEARVGTDMLFERVAYQASRLVPLSLGSVQSGVNAERVDVDGLAHFGNVGLYAEAMAGDDALRITPGVRADLLQWGGRTHVVLDPRLWVRRQLTASLGLFAYAGLYHQAPEATEIDPRFGNPALEPETAQQYGLGVEHRVPGSWTFKLEGFYQRRSGLPFAAPVSLRADGSIDNPLLSNSGVAHAAGFEVLIRKELSSVFYGWLAYTFSRSQQLLRPGYGWQPTPFDQPHVLTLLVGLRASTQVEFSSRLRLASGNPVAPASGGIFDSDTGAYAPYAQPFGSSRLPTFIQLDFQINNIWTGDDVKLGLYLEAQNVLNQRNSEVLVYDYRFSRSDAIPSVPLLASVGARVSW